MGAFSAIVPLFIVGVPLYGLFKRIDVYDAFVEGARAGLKTAVSVVPYLAAMLIAMSILRASGALEALLDPLKGWLGRFGFPAEVLPLAVMRPLSGSGALAIVAELMERLGPDAREARIAACIMGSSETIFYTLSLYCGKAGIRRVRYALWVSLVASLAGVMAAVWICG